MATKQKSALGKGLAALIPSGLSMDNAVSGLSTQGYSENNGARVILSPIDDIVPSPFQPRNKFTPDQLEELVTSIREHGIIQPLIVRKINNQLELIAGERRWRASKSLGLKEVPVIIRAASDRDVLEWALVENLQREDLNPIEEAAGYARLAKEFKLKQDHIASRVGKSRATIANAIRLLELNPFIQDFLVQGKLSVGHAKAILSVKDKEKQLLIAQDVIAKNYTVRQTETAVRNILYPPVKPEKIEVEKSKSIILVEQDLSKVFQTKVTLNQSSSSPKGKLEIHYTNKDELTRVLELLGIEIEVS